jgi:hypothetical protein
VTYERRFEEGVKKIASKGSFDLLGAFVFFGEIDISTFSGRESCP